MRLFWFTVSRPIPKYEETAILKHIHDLYNCELDSIPTDTLAHYTTTQLIQRRMESHAQCVKTVNEGRMPNTREWALPNGRVEAPWYCKWKIDPFCPRQFSLKTKSLFSCWYCLHQDDLSTNDTSEYANDMLYNPDCNRAIEKFQLYYKCMNNFRRAMEPCVGNLSSVCREASLFGIKTIRLRADLVFQLLIDDPDLKIVHQIRDPRGIVYSRKRTALLSLLSGKNIVNEASILCQRISYDVGILSRLEQQFPGRILQIKYEDLVVHPQETAQEFYDFLGVEMPPEVTSWFNDLNDTVKEGNAFSTIRRNSTATAFKWQTVLKADDIASITEKCLDVIIRHGYPLKIIPGTSVVI